MNTPTLPPIPFDGTWRWLVEPLDSNSIGRINLQEGITKHRPFRGTRTLWFTRAWTVYEPTTEAYYVTERCKELIATGGSNPVVFPGVYTRNGHRAN